MGSESPNKRKKGAAIALIAGAEIALLGALYKDGSVDQKVLDAAKRPYEMILQDEKAALPLMALLAHGHISKPIQLLADPALRHIRNVEPASVLPIITGEVGASFGSEYRAMAESTHASGTKLSNNDADSLSAYGKRATLSKQVDLFSTAAQKYSNKNPIELGQAIAMVSRNIYWKQALLPMHRRNIATSVPREVPPQMIPTEETIAAYGSGEITNKDTEKEVAAIARERENASTVKKF
jgi:hypothetical protein